KASNGITNIKTPYPPWLVHGAVLDDQSPRLYPLQHLLRTVHFDGEIWNGCPRASFASKTDLTSKGADLHRASSVGEMPTFEEQRKTAPCLLVQFDRFRPVGFSSI